MSDQNIPPTNDEQQPAVCSTGCKLHSNGVLRAALYTPVVLMLGALAALATFPELARYATPLVGESDTQTTCPISAVLAMMGHSSCSSQTASTGCCSASSVSVGGCCGMKNFCPSSSETTVSDEVTDAEPATSAEEAPADAISAVNAVDLETASN